MTQKEATSRVREVLKDRPHYSMESVGRLLSICGERPTKAQIVKAWPRKGAQWIDTLPTQAERDYATFYRAWLREEEDSQPWEGEFGLSHDQAQHIRRTLGTMEA